MLSLPPEDLWANLDLLLDSCGLSYTETRHMVLQATPAVTTPTSAVRAVLEYIIEFTAGDNTATRRMVLGTGP